DCGSSNRVGCSEDALALQNRDHLRLPLDVKSFGGILPSPNSHIGKLKYRPSVRTRLGRQKTHRTAASGAVRRPNLEKQRRRPGESWLRVTQTYFRKFATT